MHPDVRARKEHPASSLPQVLVELVAELAQRQPVKWQTPCQVSTEWPEPPPHLLALQLWAEQQQSLIQILVEHPKEELPELRP